MLPGAQAQHRIKVHGAKRPDAEASKPAMETKGTRPQVASCSGWQQSTEISNAVQRLANQFWHQLPDADVHPAQKALDF